MKANQKFLHRDEAVSPVIAVILMVAITVVLAATVYVWVSQFSASGSQPAKAMSLSSTSALSGTWKNYTINAATSGMKYSDMTLTVNGATYAIDSGGTCSGTPYTITSSTKFLACGGTTVRAGSSTVAAGDVIYLIGMSNSQTLRILDANANSVMLTLAIG